MATNVVLLLLVVVSTKAFFISRPIVVKLRIDIADNVFQTRTCRIFHLNP